MLLICISCKCLFQWDSKVSFFLFLMIQIAFFYVLKFKVDSYLHTRNSFREIQKSESVWLDWLDIFHRIFCQNVIPKSSFSCCLTTSMYIPIFLQFVSNKIRYPIFVKVKVHFFGSDCSYWFFMNSLYTIFTCTII